MFMIQRPSPRIVDAFLSSQRTEGFSYLEVGRTSGIIPSGYNVDHNRAKLGRGAGVFSRAIACLRDWQMFRLGWVELFKPGTPIEVGATVAVMVNHFGFWSLNASRIVYVLREERRFGFAYGTLKDHAERGEERFLIEWSTEDDAVWYDILAFSKPEQWQARFAWPLGRMLQKRFARDSMAAMKKAVG